jgi:diguanylate cyclase (GGDEF)-like protein/PAS domain S-box-containing protein
LRRWASKKWTPDPGADTAGLPMVNRPAPDRSLQRAGGAATEDAGLEAVLDATRQLLRITTAAEAGDVARNLITVLGGQIVPAAGAPSSDALPVDVSFGQGVPLVPLAPPLSVARLLLERHLPSFMLDAQRALARVDKLGRLAANVRVDTLHDDEDRAVIAREATDQMTSSRHLAPGRGEAPPGSDLRAKTPASVVGVDPRVRTAQGTAVPRDWDDIWGVFDVVPDAMVGVDRGGVIRFVNQQAETMFGFGRGALVGQLIEVLLPESFRAAHQGQREGYVADPKTRKMGGVPELTGRKRDGTEFPVDIGLAHSGADDDLLVITAVRDVTARHESEKRRRQKERISAVVEFNADAIITFELDGRITDWNPAAERLFGYTSQEIVGKPASLLSPKDQVGEIEDLLPKIIAGEHVEHLETIQVRKDGAVFPMSLTVSAIYDQDGTVVGASAIGHDVTEQKEATRTAQRLAAAEDLVHTVMRSARIGIALTDKESCFVVVNSAFSDLLGYDETWFLTHRVNDIIHPDDLEAVLVSRRRTLAGTNETHGKVMRLVRADGASIWARRSAVVIPGGDGQPDQLMVQVEDITAEHEAHEALAHQASHDPLTGLHNRAWIMNVLKVDLRAARLHGSSVGILLVDVDNLKVVNDSLGHAAGEKVLAAIAKRIEGAMREGDRLGRFSGDKFVIGLQDVHEARDAEQCAERVSDAVAADLKVHSHRIVPTVSIGIALSTSKSTPGTLLRDADSALFRAKRTGRAHWQLFDAVMHAQAVDRLTIEDELRDAITGRQFVVHYQPIVALADGHVVGHEALIRWMHPTRGLLLPADFLDVAEDSGLISSIGAQVLEQACGMLTSRPDLPGPISVNVSAVQLADLDWYGQFADSLTRHKLQPARIVIEVTETSVLNLPDSSRHALAFLHGLGVGIHVDDFGTGYSSISLLRDLPVTGVKLDLRFVHDLTAVDSQANALARGLSGLVNGLHLTGIAEGIENKMQAEILLAQGWQCGQGYYYGKPATVPVTESFMTSRSSAKQAIPLPT